jgi:hypothetical protein
MESVQSVFYQILPALLSIAIPTILLLAGWVAKKFTEKLNIQNKKSIEDFIVGLVASGVSYAEQYAHKLAKENETIHSKDKLYIAVEYVLDAARRHGLFYITQEEVEGRIESFLGLMTYDINHLTPVNEGDTDNEDSDNFTE